MIDGMRRFKISSVIKNVSKYFSSLIDKCGLGLIMALIFFNPSFAVAQSSLFSSENRTVSRLPLFYEVTAEAEAIANNFVSARKKAVKSAMKIAVQDAIETILGDQSKFSNNKTLRKIVSRPNRYVKSYRFLSSFDNTSLMSAEVRLEVEVYVQELKQKLRSIGVLTTPAEDRTVAILILETGISSSDKSFWDTIPMSEMALVQSFQEAGIQAINRNSIRDLISEETAIKAAEGDIASAVDVGYRSGTDVVIVGKAISSKSQGEGGEIQASVTLKAISASRGTLIAARSEFASALEDGAIGGEFSAFSQATSKISKFLIDSVQQFWTPKTEEPSAKRNLSTKNSVPNSTSRPTPQAPPSDVPSMFGDL
jgi:hypothetical protein